MPQSMQQLTSDTDQQTVAVVQSAADESVHKFCCQILRFFADLRRILCNIVVNM